MPVRIFLLFLRELGKKENAKRHGTKHMLSIIPRPACVVATSGIASHASVQDASPVIDAESKSNCTGRSINRMMEHTRRHRLSRRSQIVALPNHRRLSRTPTNAAYAMSERAAAQIRMVGKSSISDSQALLSHRELVDALETMAVDRYVDPVDHVRAGRQRRYGKSDGCGIAGNGCRSFGICR